MSRGEAWAATAATLAFAALAVAVHTHGLFALDFAFTLALQRFVGPLPDMLAGAISIAFAFEAVFAYAAIAAFLLARSGAGLWALAPFSFLGLTAVELIFKLFVSTEAVPMEFHRSVFYPLAEVTFPGAFPSGHAIRITFVGFAGASLVRDGASRLQMRATIITITVVLALSRVYLGHHWLSEIVGGQILGGTLGALVAQSVSRALVRPQSMR